MSNNFRLLMAAVGLSTCASADVIVENGRFRLTVGDDAVVKSLVLKATGEELLDLRDATPLFSVTQPRPFNNEIKLINPHRRTTYPANRIRREGDRLVVGFETAPYEAVVSVRETDDYVALTLEDFILTEKSYPLCPTTTRPLDFTAPPVESFRLAQLPVKNRANFGAWLNVQWDATASVAVVATSPHALVDAERRTGYRLMSAEAVREVKLRGTGAAIVVDRGNDAILDRIDALERDCGLPHGVRNRRDPHVNASIYSAEGFSPETVDQHIEMARKGGFRLMEITYHDFFTWTGDYEYKPLYPNGAADVKKILDKVHAAGILPGLHILHTFIGFNSKLVKGGADRRLQLREHYTLAKAVGPDDTEVFVDEDPHNAERMEACRLLKFGREIMSYEGFTTERPYKFTGVKRGAKGTSAAAHEEGLIGGTLWICEYGGNDIYLKQDSDLQDVVSAKVAELWKAGLRFIYFDGSEGVCAPFAYHVPNAQYRMWRNLDPEPVLGEGAAKAHFGWHMLSGANAFDVFFPEEFKAKIDEFPAAEAPLMKQDFTRVNFGWWGFWAPGAKIRGKETIGTQPDMWEYGTAKAAAWDSPISVSMYIDRMKAHPRLDDILEVMRRWEDVREKKWLTQEMKERIRQSARGFHLYLNDRSEYELHETEMLVPESAAGLRAFLFERNGKRVIAYWHTSGEGDFTLPLGANGADVTLHAAGIRYHETDLSREKVHAAFAAYGRGKAIRQKGPGERELFNGHDLTGWYVYLKGRGRNCDPQGVFSVRDGVLHVTGEEYGCITTEECFSNYVFTAEYRWLGTAYGKKVGRALDSGILFHSRGEDGTVCGSWMPCYEYNIVQGCSGQLWPVGTKKVGYAYDIEIGDEKICDGCPIWKPGAPKVRVATGVLHCSCERFDIARDWTDTRDVKLACNENPEGEWNECRLVCRGDEVECHFNGKLVNRATRLNNTSGRIQLQSEGCGIEFRNVRIKSLEEE